MNLTKGEKISFDKKPTPIPIVATNGWTVQRARNGKQLDYDLKALVLYRDGSHEYIGAANADEKLVDRTGSVRHHGDVQSAEERERIDIMCHPDIDRVALSSYSALENGPGSFNEYGVFVEAEYGDQRVQIPAAQASADENAYTCLFAEVVMFRDGSMDLIGAESYSRRGSENRVGYVGTKITMDEGPVGRNKS